MVLIRQRERAQLTRNGLLLAVFLASTVILLDNGKSLTGAVKMTDEDRLLEELFKRRHYNPDTRPAERANDVVAVEFEITPKQLTEIDSLNEVMRILIGIDMRWTDFRLAWNESDYGGLSRISIPFSKIWRPDIILTNSAEQWKKQAEMNVVVSSDGTCRWFPTMMAVSYCSIDIQWFPFDEQTCPLDFGSSSYDVSQLHVTSKREKNISDLCMGSSEWDLVEYSSIDSTVLYDGGFLSSSHVIFTFRWRRLTLYYGVIMILPCTMLFLISVVTYFIPPQMGDRISLAITTLLAMGVHQMMVSDSVPPTSDATPLIGVYFTSMMTTNAVSLIAMIVIYHLYHRSSTKPKPSDRVKSCVERLEKCLRMTEPSKDGKKQQNANSKKGKLCVEGSPLVCHCMSAEGNRSLEDTSHRPTPTAVPNIISRPTAGEEDNSTTTSKVNDQTSLHSVAKDGDWENVALVIDRLCFVVYISCLATITLVFYACAIVVRS